MVAGAKFLVSPQCVKESMIFLFESMQLADSNRVIWLKRLNGVTAFCGREGAKFNHFRCKAARLEDHDEDLRGGRDPGPRQAREGGGLRGGQWRQRCGSGARRDDAPPRLPPAPRGRAAPCPAMPPRPGRPFFIYLFLAACSALPFPAPGEGGGAGPRNERTESTQTKTASRLPLLHAFRALLAPLLHW